MTQYLGFCGIFCSTDCDIYEAAHLDDLEVKMKVVQHLEQELGITIDPSQFQCEGCQVPEEKTWFECRLCLIRRCGKKQKVRICLECEYYPCQVMKLWLSVSKSAPGNLQEMSDMGVNVWIEKKFNI